MADSRLRVEINGSDVTDPLLETGGEVEVEERIDQPDAASVTVSLEALGDGTWSSLLDELAATDGRLLIELSQDDGGYTFSGLVVGATWTVDVAAGSELVVRAVDHTVAMDRVERVRPWPGTADSAIASTIFGSYGFGAEVETTPAGPNPDLFTPIQRATDWAFLRSLAAKWGYEVFLEAEGDKIVGHFRSIDPLAETVHGLDLGYGDDGRSPVDVEVDFDGGGSVAAARIPALAGGPSEAEADGTDHLQGSEPVMAAATTLLGPDDVDGEIDPFRAAAGKARKQAFGVRLTTTTHPITGTPLIRARRTLDVGGLGPRLSGAYLVERVRHRVTRDQHLQEIALIRNALGSGSGSAGGIL